MSLVSGALYQGVNTLTAGCGLFCAGSPSLGRIQSIHQCLSSACLHSGRPLASEHSSGLKYSAAD